MDDNLSIVRKQEKRTFWIFGNYEKSRQSHNYVFWQARKGTSSKRVSASSKVDKFFTEQANMMTFLFP